LAVVGMPPGKFQAYVKILVVGAQLLIVATGFIFAVPQELLMAAIETVGGFFTVTVLERVVLPQELVVVSEMV
jgi:hypothetical protein